MTEPKTMIDLTFTAHLHVPADLCPTFSLYKPGSIFSTLETAFGSLVPSFPSVGLTEINSFLVSPPLLSLPLNFVSGEWQSLVCLGPPEPGALVPLFPSYNHPHCGLFCVLSVGLTSA